MDKQGYKDIISDYVRESSQLSNYLNEILNIVKETPNNMQLGKKIRQYVYEMEESNDNTRDIR